MKNKKSIQLKNSNKKVNNLTKKLFNQKMQNKNLTPRIRKDINFNKCHFSEFNSFINDPGLLRQNRQNAKKENYINKINESLHKTNQMKQYYASNSEMTNFSINQNIEDNTKKRLILNVNNRKKARESNGNNSIGKGRNINSLKNYKGNNFLYSRFSTSSLSSALDNNITFRQIPKEIDFR